MATNLQRFFSEYKMMLQASVVFPIMFLRSSKYRELPVYFDVARRKQIEEFCFAKTKEIIDTLSPLRFLIVGLGTYTMFKKCMGETGSEHEIRVENNGKDRLAVESKWKDIRIFAVKHLT